MSIKLYYHRIADEHFYALKSGETIAGITFSDLLPPNWCDYPNPTDKRFGCPMLTHKKTRTKVSKKSCSNCVCYKFYEINHGKKD